MEAAVLGKGRPRGLAFLLAILCGTTFLLPFDIAKAPADERGPIHVYAIGEIRTHASLFVIKVLYPLSYNRMTET